MIPFNLLGNKYDLITEVYHNDILHCMYTCNTRRCCCVWVVQPFYMLQVTSSVTSYSHCYKVILIEVVCQYSVFLLIVVQKLTSALLESVEEEECP